MIIDKNAVYSVSEASELTNLHPRLLRRLALSIKAKKIDNRYVFSGFQLIEYLKKKKKNVENYDDLKDELIELRQVKKEMSEHIQKMSDNVLTLSNDNQQLSKHITELTLKIELLQNDLANEKSKFKEVVTKEIPHQQKLKEAIQLITLEAMEQNVQHKVFTDEEYNDIIGTLSEVEFQTKQVEYLKGRVEKQDGILEKLVQQVSERNFIEAKEKGLDKS